MEGNVSVTVQILLDTYGPTLERSPIDVLIVGAPSARAQPSSHIRGHTPGRSLTSAVNVGSLSARVLA